MTREIRNTDQDTGIMMTQTRQIAGHNVGAVGLGCMSFGGIYGETDLDESLACLHEAVALGVTHLDVAEIYGMGRCEDIIGQFLRETGAHVTLATKAGIYQKPTRHFKNDYDTIRASLEGSLTRLGRDKVELFYLHRRDPEMTIEAAMETLARLRDEGLIGAAGLSEVSPATLRRAATVMPVAAVQNEYSLWTRLPELGLIQTCAELGTTFVAFSPLGRGVLTDHFPDMSTGPKGDFRRPSPRFTEPNYTANKAQIEGFRAFCANRGWTTAAGALAWLLDRGEHVLPIPGTRSAKNLRDCVGALQIRFTPEDRAEIARLLPTGFAHGARYSSEQSVGVESYC